MTNREAIEELKQIPFNEKATEERLKPIYEAIDIAIKALDKEKEKVKVKDVDKLMDKLDRDEREAFTKHQVWLLLSEYNTEVPTFEIDEDLLR